ncbi:hypothetical protein R1flu_008092 [Riccia fluitans]|uniref:Uncharacterized protein n=1 Tax=Riccia fluitans TaxID=41844 RepID=A0ABD1YAR3_9MARC
MLGNTTQGNRYQRKDGKSRSRAVNLFGVPIARFCVAEIRYLARKLGRRNGRDCSSCKAEFSTSNRSSTVSEVDCLAQSMIDSWTKLFLTSFHASQSVELLQVSVVDSWFLSLRSVRSLLLKSMSSPVLSTGSQPPGRTLYAFGDSYYFRKELGIPNMLSGYVFLVDTKGRVRWRASGFATAEELASMILHRAVPRGTLIPGFLVCPWAMLETVFWSCKAGKPCLG